MTFVLRSLAIAGAFVLASCGGGGGSPGSGNGGIGGGGPQSVAITETNAKPVAASAMDATQNSSATSGATLPVAVQVEGAGPTNLQVIADIARRAAQSFRPANLPSGIAISQTEACTLGGTATISGNVASPNGIGAGDSLTISMNNCAESVGGLTTVMNGQMSVTIASGTIGDTLPFHVVMNVTATNLSTQAGGVTSVGNGDVRLDWTVNSATSQTLSATGNSMSSRQTSSGTTRSMTLRNYSQTLSISGSTFTGALNATVETDSTRMGSTAVTYTVTTQSPLVWSAATRLPTAGVLKVVGANNSQLVSTFNADGTVSIQVDANADGGFERTVASTAAELSGLR